MRDHYNASLSLRLALLIVCVAVCMDLGAAEELEDPFLILFKPAQARFIRFTPLGFNGGTAVALDEIEVFAPGSVENLASAANGARATASSCLAGNAKHAVAHLNDGRYGNDFSWIAASGGTEWVQIELPEPATVDAVTFSRDRTGKFTDRTPTSFRLELSLDGKEWKLAAHFPGPGGGMRAPIMLDRQILEAPTRKAKQETSLASRPRKRLSGPDPAAQYTPGGESLCLNGADWWMRQVPGQPHWTEWPADMEAQEALSKELPVSGLGRGTEWVRATVPGSVQTAILENGLAPMPWHEGLNLQALQRATVGKQSWFFKRFRVPASWRVRRVRLRFGGVDYRAHYYVNGRHVGASEGHFAPVMLDVDHALRWDGENVLAVQIDAFPYDSPIDAAEGRPLAAQMARTQVVANLLRFDFVAPSCPLGITHDVHLLAGDTAMIEDLWVRCALDDDYKNAMVSCQVTAHSARDVGARLEIAIRAEGASKWITKILPAELKRGSNTMKAEVNVSSPKLWWPNGYGPQNLYEARARLVAPDGRVLHEARESFGIRKLEMAFNDGHDMAPYPWTFVINGEKVYMKGGGWVPMTPLHLMEASRYEEILRQARAAHFTMIRWWGGGVPERSAFYDLCDRLGILVFQDFFLANNEHDNPRFLKLIDTQAPAFMKRLRNHPCIALWTGGNELFNGTVNYYAQEKLWKIAGEHDPDRPFYPSSPAIGAKHAITDYAYNPDRDYATANGFGVDPELRMKIRTGAYPNWNIIGQPQNAYYQRWIARLKEKGFDPANAAHHANAFDVQFTAEGGASAVANLSTLRRIISEEELSAFNGHKLSPSWLYHNAKPGAYDWLQHAETERIFGPIDELDRYVAAGQFARGQILAYGLEEMRRRKFRFSGTLMWQLNESWPNAAGNALVDNFGTPRITYDSVQRAYEPIHPSLRFDRIKWRGGEDFKAELWVTNDRLHDLACIVEWRVLLANGEEAARGSEAVAAARNASAQAGSIAWPIPAGYDTFFIVYLCVRDAATQAILGSQEYVHSAHTSSKHFFAALLACGKTALKLIRVKTDGATATYRVENTGARNALLCRLELDVPEGVLVTRSINSFCLAPDASQTVVLDARSLRDSSWKPRWDSVTCRALNAESSR